MRLLLSLFVPVTAILFYDMAIGMIVCERRNGSTLLTSRRLVSYVID